MNNYQHYEENSIASTFHVMSTNQVNQSIVAIEWKTIIQ